MRHDSTPRLKPTVRVYKTHAVIHFETSGFSFEVDDKDGLIAALCELMDGTRTILRLAKDLGAQYEYANADKVHDVLGHLDEAYLIEDAAAALPAGLDSYDAQRWHRNLDFFGAFCRFEENKYEQQLKIKNARVALLGLGGLGSHLLYDLVALGVHDIRAVDFDRVELANLNRQILYGERHIGQLKTDIARQRISELSSRLTLDFVNKRLTSAADIRSLIHDRDIVICVADKPRVGIVDWLNEACVKQGVPFINGGLDTRRAIYYSVIPFSSGCVECWRSTVRANDELSALVLDEHQQNRHREEAPRPAIVHLVSVITGHMIAEFIKLTTGISPPTATNRLLAIDFETMRVAEAETWGRRPGCSVCAVSADAHRIGHPLAMAT